MNVAPLFFWSFLCLSAFGKGNPVRLERLFCWQEEEGGVAYGTLILFWVIWKARNSLAFEDGVLSIQKLKISFVYLLWSETKLWIKDSPSTLIDFIEWVCMR